MKTQRQKGSKFERDLVRFMSTAGKWKRVPGSGSLSSTTEYKELSGDVVGYLHPDLEAEFSFIVEAKHGYGGSKQITLKKEWIDKARKYAEMYGSSKGIFPTPFVVVKPNYSRMEDSFVVIRLADFRQLLINIIQLYEELLTFQEDLLDHEY